MSFSQATITDVRTYRDGSELVIEWNSSSPQGTVFQVYLGGRRLWSGTRRTVHVPWPRDPVTIDVGTVAAGEGGTDFAGTLAAAPEDRAYLTWLGGLFLGADIAGFRIYGSSGPGLAVDYSNVLATLPAYVGGITTAGFGVGGFGQGGFGSSAGSYSWTSGRLGAGEWRFAVAPYDSHGNQDESPATASVVIMSPPRAPAADGDGVRLAYTYNATTHVATLTWLASPG